MRAHGDGIMTMDWVPQWAPGVAAVLTSIGALWRTTLTEERAAAATRATIESTLANLQKGDQNLAKELSDMSHEVRTAADELREIAMAYRVSSAEQAVVNKVTTATLADVVNKLDGHSKMLADHATSISLMRELTTRNHHKGV